MEPVYPEKTFKEWMINQFERDELQDIVNHGVDAGFSGLIYYSDTSNLYQQYHKDIWGVINETADDQGITPLKLISDFGGAKHVCDEATFVNLLVWFCAETVAYEIIETNDSNEEELP